MTTTYPVIRRARRANRMPNSGLTYLVRWGFPVTQLEPADRTLYDLITARWEMLGYRRANAMGRMAMQTNIYDIVEAKNLGYAR